MVLATRQGVDGVVALLPSKRNSGITSSGTPSSGWIPPPCWPTSPRSCRRITLLPSRRRCWRGRHRHPNQRRRGLTRSTLVQRAGVPPPADANGRGRADTAKPTTPTTAKPTTGSIVDRVRAAEDWPDCPLCWDVCLRGSQLRRRVRGRANGVGGNAQQLGCWRLKQVRTRRPRARGEPAVGQLHLPHL